jgi:hypothetical protein
MIERPLNEFPHKVQQMFSEIQNARGCAAEWSVAAPNQTVPYGTDSFFALFQALRARLPS